ncbi:MAG: hypothetical protein CMJ24_10960 [Phycisphaerae bacterium]|nr:hypothetical protein [Phycisphaerae bacterium]
MHGSAAVEHDHARPGGQTQSVAHPVPPDLDRFVRTCGRPGLAGFRRSRPHRDHGRARRSADAGRSGSRPNAGPLSRLAMNDPIHITVLSFAELAERLGSGRIELELPGGSDVTQAMTSLARLHPAVESRADTLAIAINERYADRSRILEDGDVMALISPVSGG